MEPFCLTLEQVTFNESDVCLDDELDSFSNVVCYDHELVNGDTQFKSASPKSTFHGAPFNSSLGSSVYSVIPNNNINYPSSQYQVDKGEEGIINVQYQVHFHNPVVQLSPTSPTSLQGQSQKQGLRVSTASCQINEDILYDREDQLNEHILYDREDQLNEDILYDREEKQGEKELLWKDEDPVAKVHTSFTPLDLDSVNAILTRIKMASESSLTSDTERRDSFSAFTSTTEALALQKSVIGGVQVKPASAEEIARVIAATHQKLNLSRTVPHTEQSPTPQDSHVTAISDVSSHSDQSFGQIDHTHNITSKSDQSLGQIDHAHNITTSQSDQSFDQIDHTHKHFVRIPATDIQITVSRSEEIKHKLTTHATAKSMTRSTTASRKRRNKKADIKKTSNELFANNELDVSAMSYSSSVSDVISVSDLTDSFLNVDVMKGVPVDSEEKFSKGSNTLVTQDNSGCASGGDAGLLVTGVRGITTGSLATENTSTTLRHTERVNAHTLEMSALNLSQQQPMRSSTPFTTPGKTTTVDRQQLSSGAVVRGITKNRFGVLPARELVSGGQVDVDQLLREKANLEGQIEMLKVEADWAVGERAELQTQLAAVTYQVKSPSPSSLATFKDRGIILDQVHSAKMQRDKLEREMVALQKLFDEKVFDNQVTNEDVKLYQDANRKLQEKIDALKDSLSEKDSEISEFKNDLAAVTYELQTVRQEKRQTENEIHAVMNEISATTKTKEWYKQQLKTSQETRSQLQKDVSKLHLSGLEQSSNVERLKSDNVHIKQQLAENQQRALQEKEMLAAHLEIIEADMLEREAALQQMHSDQAINEGSLHERIKRVEDEKHKLSSLVGTASDLESELSKFRNELAQKNGQMAVLEHDQAQMMKRVTLSQESLAQRDKEHETLEAKYMELECKLKEFQANCSDKDGEILTMKEQNAALLVALSSANNEKRAIDKVVDTLREDMDKVGTSFRQMKLEMRKKDNCLTNLSNRKVSLEAELDKTRDELNVQQKSFDEFNQSVSGKFLLVHELNEEKEKLQSDTISLTGQVETLKDSLKKMIAQNSLVEEHLAAAERRVNEVSGELSSSNEQRALAESNLQSAMVEQGKLTVIRQENEALKVYITELNTNAGNQLLIQQKDLERLQQELAMSVDRAMKAEQTYENDVAGQAVIAQEAMIAQKSAQEQLVELTSQLAEGEVKSRERVDTQHEMQEILHKVQRLEMQREKLKAELTECAGYETRITELEDQLREAEHVVGQHQSLRDESMELALELEREKGRLAGVMQNHAALKQHTSQLEDALAQKESSIVQITSRTQQELEEVERQSASRSKKIEELESVMQKEKDENQHLKKQIGSEKLSSSRIRKQNDVLKMDVHKLSQELDDVSGELAEFKNKVDANTKADVELQVNLASLRSEYHMAHTEIESLSRQLEQNKEKDPVVDESLKTLQLDIDQKSAEISGWKCQMKLTEERQQREMNSMKQAIQVTKTEINKLRSELVWTRKEKFNFQAKLSELRGTVTACLGACFGDVHGNQGTAVMNGTNEHDNCNYQSALNMIHKILEDTSPPDYATKPLAALHQCLSSLHYQMSGLQKEIDDHSMTISHTAQSWKQVETQVKELHELCSSDECSASCDGESVSSGRNAEEIVDKFLANEALTKKKLATHNPSIDV